MTTVLGNIAAPLVSPPPDEPYRLTPSRVALILSGLANGGRSLGPSFGPPPLYSGQDERTVCSREQFLVGISPPAYTRVPGPGELSIQGGL
jgi:hypothetical protein